ncbi:MAG: glutamine--fructose-6-phosphate transaminase (isomerizing) [Candidatus Marinimicrobia bacterium]|nr:glutamine--fructose-6-phosphate transaminase (isomerizing) [Candidatus Neomarinimicrobiota bacterium]MCH8068455.1 glutamine--fructose-6-phosphate transaminase (isomerizing) [Candidatus Neomarinimicrobiota bacterium]
MCGIVGYLGDKDAIPILINGLKRLEYRGYDSAGVAIVNSDGLHVVKRKGKVKELKCELEDTVLRGSIGMGHTRWATHGIPSDLNAHPHMDMAGRISIVHNGIIENYDLLKTVLEKDGIIFQSDTDTEVLVQLISKIYSSSKMTVAEAVQEALREVVGTYGIVVVSADEPDTLVVARLGSPLLLGIGEDEYFVASDASPIIEHTRNVVYLDDGEMAIITRKGYKIIRIRENHVIHKVVERIEFNLEEIEKGGFPHFMLKEIHDQTHSITDTFRGRLLLDTCRAHLGGIRDYLDHILNAKQCYITACGTSWHASLIGGYLLEEYARIKTRVEYASEFRYRNAVVDPDTVLIAVSQSGETADTLAAIRKGKEYGALTVGICNVVGSTIARETDCGIYTHAGPEIGVASTKAFTSQVAVFLLLTLQIGREHALKEKEAEKICSAMANISDHVKTVMDMSDEILEVAYAYKDKHNFLYLGRGLNFPVALEGALKLKEISYIHAEGYPAAEMKHGPIALIDENMPVVVLAPRDRTYDKVLSNIQEIKARKGKVISVTDAPTKQLISLSDHIITVPKVHRVVFPILATIPLQLLAYHIAVLRGCNVDQPRNLAKSVTVE